MATISLIQKREFVIVSYSLHDECVTLNHVFFLLVLSVRSTLTIMLKCSMSCWMLIMQFDWQLESFNHTGLAAMWDLYGRLLNTKLTWVCCQPMLTFVHGQTLKNWKHYIDDAKDISIPPQVWFTVLNPPSGHPSKQALVGPRACQGALHEVQSSNVGPVQVAQSGKHSNIDCHEATVDKQVGLHFFVQQNAYGDRLFHPHSSQ